MNTKRYIWASLAVFLFIFMAEFVFHALIMQESYNLHLQLLRSQTEQQATFPIMLLGFLVLAFGFCWVFVKGYEGQSLAEGARFGLYVGIAFGVSSNMINYSVFPYPGSWVIGWAVGETLIMILAGVLAAVIYRRKKSMSESRSAGLHGHS